MGGPTVMKDLEKRSLHVFAILFMMVFSSAAQAQKLPPVQKKGLITPEEIKIDSKAAAWNDYQAYDRHTELYYTLSNDDTHLYLLVRSENRAITAKLLRGGLTFRVATTAEGLKTAPASITYPVPAPDGMRQLMAMAINFPNKTPGIEWAYVKTAPERDSLLYLYNQAAFNRAKDVYVSGINAIPENYLSIYNDYHINVRPALNRNSVYTCKIAIPLKYLGITDGTAGELWYSLALNGPSANVLRNYVSFQNYSIGTGSRQRNLMELGCTTNMKAKYMLANK
jgi:hypothetical protein